LSLQLSIWRLSVSMPDAYNRPISAVGSYVRLLSHNRENLNMPLPLVPIIAVRYSAGTPDVTHDGQITLRDSSYEPYWGK